jgi:hypothetical protein
MVSATSESRPDGVWERIVECPELPECRVAAATITEAMDTLGRRRVETIVGLLGAGERPPVPRPPLRGLDVQRELRELGLLDALAGLLELHETELRGRSSAIPT